MLTMGRPGYTHFIAVSRTLTCPEVLPIAGCDRGSGPQPVGTVDGHPGGGAGGSLCPRSGGGAGDPRSFCGVGTVPAVANVLGLDAIGVERSAKRCEQSRQVMVMPEDL